MNRNTVQRSPRGGVGVGGHCSLPGGRPCGMRGRGAPGLAPPLCGHSSLAAGQAGPRCTHTRTRRGGAQGATSARRKQTRITPRGPDPLPLAWGPASGTHPQHPHPRHPPGAQQPNQQSLHELMHLLGHKICGIHFITFFIQTVQCHI